jgi:NAD(P)-dependent dehydrogenase (short-subunit alcohol dehydrogenase family)
MTVRKMTVEDWDRVIQVNLSGAFYLPRAILQHMLDRGSGRIINISSIIGEAATSARPTTPRPRRARSA